MTEADRKPCDNWFRSQDAFSLAAIEEWARKLAAGAQEVELTACDECAPER